MPNSDAGNSTLQIAIGLTMVCLACGSRRVIQDSWAACPGAADDPPVVVFSPAEAARKLAEYRAHLAAFRGEFRGTRDMPDVPFFQFGMGARQKYLYKAGVLREAATGRIVAPWEITTTTILPPDYAVCLTTTSGHDVQIQEDEQAVWISEQGVRRALPGTQKPLHLPTFAEHRHAAVLRVLHHEILINVINGWPVPNHFVYKKPWYRDEAVDRDQYPYLGWATDHFQGRKLGPISNRDYPLTWEIKASQADYPAMAIVDPVFARQQISVPHTWHAAEIFLYLLDLQP